MILKDEKIASTQMLFLLVTVVSVTAFLFVPAITSETAGRDGWISVFFLATGFGVIVSLVCARLGLYFPDQTIIEYAPQLVGPVLGKTIGLLYFIFFLHVNAIIVREFGDFLVTAFMPETPLLVFNIVVLMLAASAVRNGFEVIVRMNQFLFPLFIGALLIIITLNIGEMNPGNLLPVLERGIKPVILGSLTPSAWRGEVVVVLMLLPYLNKSEEARNTLIIAVLLIAIILSVLIMASTMVFGPLQDSHFMFPTLELAKYISLGEFLERMEAVIVIVWVAGITIKVAVFYLAAVLACAQFFKVENERPLVYPMGIITLVFSVSMFGNSRELVDFISKVFPIYAFVFELFIPAFLLLVATIRMRGGRRNA
ncbi:GerAB/ArcD/ProY family transporter [Thermincola ferriacetica]